MRTSFTSIFFGALPAYIVACAAFAFSAGATTPSGAATDVSEFGAVGDGAAVNTVPLQKAIDACAVQGGGVVKVPAGKYVTGTLQLKSGVTLHLDHDAVLLGSTNAADYVNVDPFVAGDGVTQGYALVVAMDATNVGIEGEGTIDGRGKEVKAAQASNTVSRNTSLRMRCP